MNFELSETQKQYKAEIYNFSKENLNDTTRLNSFPRDLWKKISGFGLNGISIPEESGGLGESYLTAAICMEA